jgi:hypothetical protein
MLGKARTPTIMDIYLTAILDVNCQKKVEPRWERCPHAVSLKKNFSRSSRKSPNSAARIFLPSSLKFVPDGKRTQDLKGAAGTI